MTDDDYLWDRSGPVDPNIAALEQALAPLAAAPHDELRARRRRRAWPYVAVGAALVAAAALLLWWRAAPPAPCGGGAGMAFVAVGGGARCGGVAVARGALPVGPALETGNAEVELVIADIGRAVVAPGSRVALRGTGAGEHRLRLERGALHARVDAPPRLFVVETPASTAVDLGCEYTLRVEADGAGALDVLDGLVELSSTHGPVVVVAGSGATFAPGEGAGVPVARDAPAAVRALARGRDVTAGLAAARVADALTLVHLALRLAEAARAPVVARLRELAPPPADVGDDLARWRDALVVGRVGEVGGGKGKGK